MTEREKRIEELYDKFRKWANENFTISYSGATVMSVPSVEGLLTRIVHYTIRKEEEVQREERKKIYEMAKRHYKLGDLRTFMNAFRAISGVEVEE